MMVHRWRDGLRVCLNGDGCLLESRYARALETSCGCDTAAGVFCYYCQPWRFNAGYPFEQPPSPLSHED